MLEKEAEEIRLLKEKEKNEIRERKLRNIEEAKIKKEKSKLVYGNTHSALCKQTFLMAVHFLCISLCCYEFVEVLFFLFIVLFCL